MRLVTLGDFADDRVKALLTQHLAGMHAASPAGHVFALDWSGLQGPQISFYTLWDGPELLGCGALKELDPQAGEIKSMRTADAHLRKGVAAALLEHIIAEARRRGYGRRHGARRASCRSGDGCRRCAHARGLDAPAPRAS